MTKQQHIINHKTLGIPVSPAIKRHKLVMHMTELYKNYEPIWSERQLFYFRFRVISPW